MTLQDEAFALLDVAVDAGGDLIDKVVARSRDTLPIPIFNKLPPRALSGSVTARRDVDVLVATRSEEGLRIWIESAKTELGRLSERAARQLAGSDDLGRDPTLGKSTMARLTSGQEKTKHELLDDLVTVQWFAGGQVAAAAIAYVSVPRFKENGKPFAHERPAGGTAFLIAPDLVMTAFHVVEARDRTTEAPADPGDLLKQIGALRLMFNYERRDQNDKPSGTEVAVTEMVVHDVGLDIAVLRLSEKRTETPLTFRKKPLPEPQNGLGFVANIIQHPNHEPKKVGLRNNAVWALDKKQLYYFTDTRGGSSGAPVFDDKWHVIAIHTGFDPIKGDEPIYLGRRMAVVNRGTLASRLIIHFANDANVRLSIG